MRWSQWIQKQFSQDWPLRFNGYKELPTTNNQMLFFCLTGWPFWLWRRPLIRLAEMYAAAIKAIKAGLQSLEKLPFSYQPSRNGLKKRWSQDLITQFAYFAKIIIYGIVGAQKHSMIYSASARSAPKHSLLTYQYTFYSN